MPYTNVISGMIAAIGAACEITQTGSVNHSNRRDRPMARPSPTPKMPHRPTPTIIGLSVSP